MPQTRNFRPEIPALNVGELKPTYYYDIFPSKIAFQSSGIFVRDIEEEL